MLTEIRHAMLPLALRRLGRRGDRSDVKLFSVNTCVWTAGDFERLARLPVGRDPGGKFIIVQSRTRIPVERVRDYCPGFAS